MQLSERFKWICSSKTPNELEEKYDQWALTYEAEIVEFWTTVPLAAAKMLAKYMSHKKDWILDIGAGTGMVGLALADLGFENIIGLDISPGMLAQADQKGVYKTLICSSIAEEQSNILEKVSGMVAAGVFAEGQAGASELALIQSRAKPGSILVFTSRQSFLPQLQPILNLPEWDYLDSEIMPIYDDPMHLLSYRINSPR